MDGRNREYAIWAALILSGVAVILSTFGFVRVVSEEQPTSQELQEQVYKQILSEVKKDLHAVYDEFGVRFDGDPETFEELLAPFLGQADPDPPGVKPETMNAENKR